MNATTQAERNALTLPQRAAVALESAKAEAELRELVAKSADITAVIDPAGREQAHRIGMTLKTARVSIEKAGKAAREDAQAFSKAVIAEEKRLIDIVIPEENRVFTLRDDFDAKVEAERQARIEAERKRIQAIKDDIAAIHDIAIGVVGKPAAAIAVALDAVKAIDVTEARFAEFCGDAQRVTTETTDKLIELHTVAVAAERAEAERKAAAEAEAKRIADERAELARLREAEAERQRLAKAEEERRAAAARAEQDRIAAEQRAELQRQAEAQRVEQERIAAAQRAEAERLEAQRREIEEADRARQQAENEFQAKLRAQAEEDQRRKEEAAAVATTASSTVVAIATDMGNDLAGEAFAMESPLEELAETAGEADYEPFPSDGELILEIRTMFQDTFGMSVAEADARMARFNYTAAAELIGA